MNRIYKLRDLYCSQNIVRVTSRRMTWLEHMARVGERRGEYGVLVGKPEGIPKHRWEGSIKVDFKEIGW